MHLFRSTPPSIHPVLSVLILFISTVLTNALALAPYDNLTSTKELTTRTLPLSVSRHDLTSMQYQSLFDSLIPQGYRLLQVTGYVSAGQECFAALFEQSPGPPQICYHGLTSEDYQIKFNQTTAQGYKLVLVNGYTSTSGTDKYVAIFEKPTSSPAWVAWHGMTNADYQQRFNDWVAKGFKLTHVSGYGVSSEPRYAAIFEQLAGSPAWLARLGMTSALYQSVFDQQVAAGFTLTLVNGYSVNNVDYYAAIFEEVSGPKQWTARHGMTSTGYQNETDTLYNLGYRLKCLSGYTISDAGRFAAIWENMS